MITVRAWSVGYRRRFSTGLFLLDPDGPDFVFKTKRAAEIAAQKRSIENPYWEFRPLKVELTIERFDWRTRARGCEGEGER